MQKLLLVDDDPHIRQIAQISLEDDFAVTVAASGAEALELSEREQPDVILLDMMMPEMDGITTLSKLKERQSTANIPVIFLTAKVQSQDLENYRKMQVVGILSKPFDPMTLPGEIRKILP
jgi:CheY-like chemotaxis protein